MINKELLDLLVIYFLGKNSTRTGSWDEINNITNEGIPWGSAEEKAATDIIKQIEQSSLWKVLE